MTNGNERGVLYLIQGNKHAVVLTVSLWSLRKHWQGPVTLLVADADTMVDHLLADERLGPLNVIRFEGVDQDHNTRLANKTRVHDLSPYERTVFLDADTMVVGPIDDLFPNQDEVVLTAFSDWTTSTGIIHRRIERWRHVAAAEIDGTGEQPAINTGVFGFSQGSVDYMTAWKEMTHRFIGSFACDEIAAQIIMPYHNIRTVDDRYNCSTRYGINKAVIWHFHGKHHLADYAAPIWWPAYCEVLHQNIAQIQDWTPAGDERLADWVATTSSRSKAS